MTVQDWLEAALATGQAGSLEPVVRREGLAATVAGLLRLEELDNRLTVEMEGLRWGTLVRVSVWGVGSQELRVQMPYNALMQRVGEVAL